MLLKWICAKCDYQFEKDSSIIDPMCPICSSQKVFDGNDTFKPQAQKRPMAKADPFGDLVKAMGKLPKKQMDDVDPFDDLNDDIMLRRRGPLGLYPYWH
jgi:DNA-directed RNA polymerase subunit RPC12/RpoP